MLHVESLRYNIISNRVVKDKNNRVAVAELWCLGSNTLRYSRGVFEPNTKGPRQGGFTIE